MFWETISSDAMMQFFIYILSWIVTLSHIIEFSIVTELPILQFAPMVELPINLVSFGILLDEIYWPFSV